jgi:hypothetical protein
LWFYRHFSLLSFSHLVLCSKSRTSWESDVINHKQEPRSIKTFLVSLITSFFRHFILFIMVYLFSLKYFLRSKL